VGLLGGLLGEALGIGRYWAHIHVLEDDTVALVIVGSEQNAVQLHAGSVGDTAIDLQRSFLGATDYDLWRSGDRQEPNGIFGHKPPGYLTCNCRRLKKEGRLGSDTARELVAYMRAFSR